MPTTSDKQERFMQAVAHNPKFAKKVGVKQKVGKEFVGMADGGEVEKPRRAPNWRIEAEVAKATGEGAPPPKVLPPGSLSKGMPVPLTPEQQRRNDAKLKALIDKRDREIPSQAKGGIVGFAKGGSIDGCAQRGKTRGRVV